MDDLLPCPFCGSKAWIYRSEHMGHYAACLNDDCGAEVMGTPTPEETAALWNRREQARACG